MKKTLLSLAVIGLAYTGSVYVIGQQAEQTVREEFKAQAELLNDQPGWSVSNLRYSKGFWRSKASFDLTLDVFANQKAVDLRVDGDILHGPVMMTTNGVKLGLFAADSRMAVVDAVDLLAEADVSDEVRTALETYLASDFIRYGIVSSFTGKQQYTVGVEPLAITDAGTDFEFGGLSAVGTGSYQSKQWDGTLNIAEIKVTDSDSQLEIAPMHGRFDFLTHSAMAADGDFELHLPLVLLNEPTSVVELKESFVKVTQTFDAEANTTSISETFAVGELQSPAPVSSATYTIDVNHIPISALERWSQMAVRLQSMDDVTDSEQAQLQSDIRELISEALQEGVELNQELQLAVMGGSVEADVDMQFAGIPGNVHLLDIDSPLVLLDALNAKLYLKGDQSVVAQTPIGPMVEVYKQQGFLKAEGDSLVVDANLQKGETTINGAPYPLREQLEAYYLMQQQMQELDESGMAESPELSANDSGYAE